MRLRWLPLLVLPMLLSAPMLAAQTALPPLPAPLAGDEAQVGRWDPVMTWPVQGEFAAMLPTGKVLLMTRGADAHLWDPRDGSMEAVPGGAVNCAGLALMPDGRVLVNGGHLSTPWQGVPDSWIFDPWTETWSRLPDMHVGRYYPGTLALPDGSMLTVSGNAPSGMDATVPERLVDGEWQLLSGAGSWMEFYPRMHVLPDGRVVRVGQDERTAFLDVDAQAWTDGPLPAYGHRWGGTSVLLAGLDRVLVTGGGSLGASSEGWGAAPALRDDAEHLQAHLLHPLQDPDASFATGRVEILELASEPRWRETASMTYARRDHSTVLLPDGKVLAVGGAYGFEPVPGWAEHALHPELFDPATESWALMAPSDRHRGYHSTAILLPDGRVLSSGGDFETGLVSVPGQDRTGQVFSPPSLFQGPRPAILAAPEEITYEQAFSVQTDGPVARATLVRLSTVTHSLNTDQRLLDLARLGETDPTHLVLQAPGTPEEAPPGWYMLFALSEAGVPSEAWMVRLDAVAHG